MTKRLKSAEARSAAAMAAGCIAALLLIALMVSTSTFISMMQLPGLKPSCRKCNRRNSFMMEAKVYKKNWFWCYQQKSLLRSFEREGKVLAWCMVNGCEPWLHGA